MFKKFAEDRFLRPLEHYLMAKHKLELKLLPDADPKGPHWIRVLKCDSMHVNFAVCLEPLSKSMCDDAASMACSCRCSSSWSTVKGRKVLNCNKSDYDNIHLLSGIENACAQVMTAALRAG